MTVFGLVDAAPELFELRRVGGGTYGAARDVLARYVDQSFSYVDAVIFTIVDADRSINRFSLVKLPLPLGEGRGLVKLPLLWERAGVWLNSLSSGRGPG